MDSYNELSTGGSKPGHRDVSFLLDVLLASHPLEIVGPALCVLYILSRAVDPRLLSTASSHKCLLQTSNHYSHLEASHYSNLILSSVRSLACSGERIPNTITALKILLQRSYCPQNGKFDSRRDYLPSCYLASGCSDPWARHPPLAHLARPSPLPSRFVSPLQPHPLTCSLTRPDIARWRSSMRPVSRIPERDVEVIQMARRNIGQGKSCCLIVPFMPL